MPSWTPCSKASDQPCPTPCSAFLRGLTPWRTPRRQRFAAGVAAQWGRFEHASVQPRSSCPAPRRSWRIADRGRAHSASQGRSLALRGAAQERHKGTPTYRKRKATNEAKPREKMRRSAADRVTLGGDKDAATNAAAKQLAAAQAAELSNVDIAERAKLAAATVAAAKQLASANAAAAERADRVKEAQKRSKRRKAGEGELARLRGYLARTVCPSDISAINTAIKEWTRRDRSCWGDIRKRRHPAASTPDGIPAHTLRGGRQGGACADCQSRSRQIRWSKCA